MLSNPCHFSAEKFRVFRPDKSYAVTEGKWYFEFEIVTAGKMRVGWARPNCTPDKDLGSDDQAYVFDGFEVRYQNSTFLFVSVFKMVRSPSADFCEFAPVITDWKYFGFSKKATCDLGDETSLMKGTDIQLAFPIEDSK